MKKILLILPVFLVMLLISCGKSPQEKIVGKWIDEEQGWGLLITADGKVKEIVVGETGGTEGTWELNDKEPFVFKILEDGELQVTIDLTFINDDEVQVQFDSKGLGEIIVIKLEKDNL
jgi:hypothetical protein